MKNKYYTLKDDLRERYNYRHSYNNLNELCNLYDGNAHLCPRTPCELVVMPGSVYRGGYKGKRGRGGSSTHHQNGSSIFKEAYSVDTVVNAPNEQVQQHQQQHEDQYSVPPPPVYMEPQYTYGSTDNVISSVQPQILHSTTPWSESFNSAGLYHPQNIQASQPQQLAPQYVNYGHPQMFANPQNQQHTYVFPMTNTSVPPPPIYSTNNGFATDPLIRPIDLNSTLINYNARNSYDVNGNDLPSKYYC